MCATCDDTIHSIAIGTLRISDIGAVLRHETTYDSLHPAGRALVRMIRDRQVDAGADGIDLTIDFLAAGESWSELDADGNVVIRNPQPEPR